VDAILHYSTSSSSVALHTAPPPPRARTKPVDNTPLYIRELIAEKRRSPGRWQRSRNQGDRLIYNRLKRKLQTALRKANSATFEHYLTSLSLRVLTPYGRLQRGLNDPKYRYNQFEKQIGVGPKVMTKKLRTLRITSNRCSHTTISQILPKLKFMAWLEYHVKCPCLLNPSLPKKW